MEINPIDIAINIINIAVLYIMLRLILYKPISNFLRKRSDSIAQNISDAEAAKTQADELRASYEAHMQTAESEAQKLTLEITQKADIAGEEIIDTAKREAETILEQAREKAEIERKEAIVTLKTQISDMSVELAGEILGREVSEADNQNTIDMFFTKAR